MLLHDDAATVRETALERQLALISAGVTDPLAGVFGPASMTWQVEREAALFLAAGRAVLLQLAHPWVAAAVAEHSRVLARPFVRFHRTFDIVFALVFGTLGQALSAARRLHRRHSSVTGVMPAAIGPFARGTPYCANNVTALRWVHATLLDSALVAHDILLPALSRDGRERYYAESRQFAGLFGVPSSFLAPDWSAFAAYVDAMSQSDVLTVSPAARDLAGRILSGTGTWLRVPNGYRALTIGMLPVRLREEFGFTYGAAERRAAEQAIEWMRRIYPLLPRRLRYVGPYQEAEARLDGRSRPDLGTQLVNRLWIGRPSLPT
jgi:uncharacterized protein (DUF2236 family)